MIRSGGQRDRMNQIVKCAIYPPIGIARVGNSPTGWFVGPEVPGCSTVPIGGYKDSDGRLKRQAAKFRVYGIDSEGNAVRELTAKDAEIHWTVHLANKKGVWYRIRFAMDISEAEPVSRRNPKHTRDRTELIIDPGPRSVGPVHPGAKELFDTGSFLGKDVPLGEIRSDEMGRLLVLGGFGNSSSVSNKPIESLDNEEWLDGKRKSCFRLCRRSQVGGIPLFPDAQGTHCIVTRTPNCPCGEDGMHSLYPAAVLQAMSPAASLRWSSATVTAARISLRPLSISTR